MCDGRIGPLFLSLTDATIPAMSRPPLAPALVAEFLGTALLVLLGDGVVASVFLLNKQADWIVITTGWGLAVALAVYVTGRIGGGHLNPAVSLALASRGEFPASRVVPYWIAQVSGGMAGAFVMYADYFSAFIRFENERGIVRGALREGKLDGTAAGGAGVFCNFPEFSNLAGNLFSEFLGTAVLLLGIRALTDRRNAAPGRGFEPLLVGALVWSIGLSLGGADRLRDQPGPRPRPADRRRSLRMGDVRVLVARVVLLGADRRAAPRRHRRDLAL